MLSVTELPFNRLLSLEAATDADRLLQLPSGDQFLNHLGTVHAGALLALAEASSGEFLLQSIGGIAGIVPVVRRLEAKFRKPSQGRVQSTASVAENALDELRTSLSDKRRALISVHVELFDETGVHTLSATVEWFITVLA